LPLSFFDHSTAGVIVKHVQQVEKIRSFLTGKLFFTLLDTLGLMVFLPVLLFYSVPLTCIVIFFSLLLTLLIAGLIPPYRRRLSRLYDAEGERQSFLVESIYGMHTIKSLALEPLRHKDWDEKAAHAIGTSFSVGRISTTAAAFSGLLEKLMTLTLIWYGVSLVFAGSITVGALIAFQMVSRRVSAPLVQLVSLMHEYQEVALSIQMLGTVMNASPERMTTFRGITTPIKGDIALDNISFSYASTTRPALSSVSLSVPAGTVVGVVGRSGSGKSTLARLLQGLYSCQDGVIRVDGTDIREFELAHLRTSIITVLQESFIFRGTIRDNIALTVASASFEQIIKAAKLAGADEFIQHLPHGYDTRLEENGSNLSGGQKQRLAIARALLANPRVLILDEATSALDAESEAVVQDSLAAIAKGRTIIIISHRLSMLINADTTFVLKEGRLVASGPHEQLMTSCEEYTTLWRKQNRHMSRPGSTGGA
jgi:ATP-binding cassette subfamily B protein